MEPICQTRENFYELASEKDVVLFGAGEYCMRFMNTLRGGIESKIKYIIDNDPVKQGGKLYGIDIVAPAILQALDADKTLVVITVASSIPSIYEQLLDWGFSCIMVARILLNYTFMNFAKEVYEGRTEINRAKNLLYDEKSKDVFSEVIRRRSLYGECDFRDLVEKGGSEYVIPLLFADRPPQDEIVLDCGACCGDTLRRFIAVLGPKLKKIYSFECMDESLAEIEKVITAVQSRDYVPEISVLPYGLSDCPGEMALAKIKQSPGSCFLTEARPYAKKAYDIKEYQTVKVDTIDNLIPADEKVTLIKMDIEGSEYAAMQGARRTIRMHKPRLAISLYHSGKDYYRLPLLAKELVPEYKIAVRHHNKNHCDTDMYCWI